MHYLPEEIDCDDKDISDPNIMHLNPYRQRRSPIIAILYPETHTETETTRVKPQGVAMLNKCVYVVADPQIAHVDIHKMIENGANGIWLKTELSTMGDKIRMIGKVDKAVDFLTTKYGLVDWPVFTCVELKTCIVNTGLIDKDLEEIFIKEGTHVTLTCDLSHYDKCSRRLIFVDNPFLAIETKVDTVINIDYDEIVLLCKQILDETSIKCLVTKGGHLKNIKPVCSRGTKRSRPLITKKDLQIVKFALEQQIDVIIINYPRHADTFKKVKQFIDNNKAKRPLLLGGLCTAEGLINIEGILKEADGMVLSREFLAYELTDCDIYRMMQIQKWTNAKCQAAGKPFYISGGVFAHTLKTGKFVMNEIQNFTNAVLEEPTGFVLKEFSDADYVVETLKMMTSICQYNEPLVAGKSKFWRIMTEVRMPINGAEAAALSCAMLANEMNARVIIIPTVTGKTAKTLLWFRPSSIIITVSTKVGSTRRSATYRCVVPLMYKGVIQKKWQNNQEARIAFAESYAVKRGWLVYGDMYVTLQRGSEASSFCDTVRVWKVTTSNKPIVECPSDEEAYKTLILRDAFIH